MKVRHRILAIGLTLSFCACDSKAPSQQPEERSGAFSASDDESEAAVSPTEENVPEPDPIVKEETPEWRFVEQLEWDEALMSLRSVLGQGSPVNIDPKDYVMLTAEPRSASDYRCSGPETDQQKIEKLLPLGDFVRSRYESDVPAFERAMALPLGDLEPQLDQQSLDME